jgi:hypothetical protein
MQAQSVHACNCDEQESAEVTLPEVKYTGAKLAEGGGWGGEGVQSMGEARLKPGRSDVPPARRTLSMSCTDKICR